MKLLIDPNLPNHRKVRRLASALGISRDTAVGMLIRFWGRVIQEAETGDLTDWGPEDLTEACGWDSDQPEVVERLTKGMVDSKWVHKTESGYEVNGWMEHQGKLIARRKADRERKRNSKPIPTDSAGIPADDHRNSTPPIRSLPSPSLPSHAMPSQSKPEPLPPSAPAEDRMFRLAHQTAAIAGRMDTLRRYVKAWLARMGEKALTKMLMDTANHGLSINEFQDLVGKAHEEQASRLRLHRLIEEREKRDAEKGVNLKRNNEVRRLGQ